MSEFHYIASPIKLDCGSFGSKLVEIETVKILSPYNILVNSTRDIKVHIPIYTDKDVEEIKRELVIFDSEEDAAGIYITEQYDRGNKVRRHFDNPYVYEVSANFATLLFDPDHKNISKGYYEKITNDYIKKNLTEEVIKSCSERYKGYRKCVRVIGDYIKERLCGSQYMEFYSAWADEEGKERCKELDTIIYLNDNNSIKELEIRDRQYIKFYLAKG